MLLFTAVYAVAPFACLLACGCTVPLPGSQVPVGSSSGKLVDPRTLCGNDHPIHAGATREAVHSAVGVDDFWFGSQTAAHKPSEWYHFEVRTGSYFWVGPNPEGGLIGINKRYMDYQLTVEYDREGRVKTYHLTAEEALDAHE